MHPGYCHAALPQSVLLSQPPFIATWALLNNLSFVSRHLPFMESLEVPYEVRSPSRPHAIPLPCSVDMSLMLHASIMGDA